MLCPLTIGISAVVYFFASTGNFPCKYSLGSSLIIFSSFLFFTSLVKNDTPEGAGTLVLASVVPSAPSHFFSFSNLFAFYVGWGKGWGERKVIMYKGTPAKCFFFSVLT